VHSTVFRWSFAPRFQALGLDRVSFSKLLKSAFAQKRKTLANNLRAAGFSTSHIQNALRSAAIAPQARAEELSLDHFAALHHALTVAQ
jgi:16S rRNA (adenine1518-N6/adenine1519-N6)-dimethyltransferase